MEGERFDTLVRTLSALVSRRRVVLALPAAFSGLFGLANLSEAKRKTNKKKKRKKRPQPFCPTEPLRRCFEPSATALADAIATCQSSCADPDAAACHACLDPALEATATATFACLNEHCRGGLAEGVAASGGARMARAATTCDAAAVKQCFDDAKDDLKSCLKVGSPACLAGPGGCVGAIIACSMTSKGPFERCNRPPAGCGTAGYCKDGVCCPHWADTVCNGVCCRTHNCETCQNGVCKGCGKEQVCTVSPAQTRECRCLKERQECGDQCCDQKTCEECAFVDGVGACFSTCTPPQVCEPGTFSGTCVCPPDREECDETCCEPQESCRNGVCTTCGEGTTRCAFPDFPDAFDCCTAEETCCDGSCCHPTEEVCRRDCTDSCGRPCGGICWTPGGPSCHCVGGGC